MKNYIIFLFLIVSNIAICQDQFNLKLNYQNSKNDTIYVNVDNGIEERQYFLSETPLEIEDFFTSHYVSIQLYHPRRDNKLPSNELGFFTNSSNSSLTVGLSENGEPYLIESDNLSLFEEMGSQQLRDFAKIEFDNFWNFYNENVSLFGSNDSITDVAFKLNELHNLKVSEAIKLNESTYYSFWTFRRQLSNNPDVSREDKEQILLTKFQAYKDTYEYEQVKELIFGSEIRLGEVINNFESVDFMTDQKINLEGLPKPLLIMTWATWCSPCIYKMNLLREISLNFPELEFLFINTDKEIEKAKKFINDKEIKGNHFSDINTGIPIMLLNQVIGKVYLIDNELKITYNIDLTPDPDLEILKEHLATILN